MAMKFLHTMVRIANIDASLDFYCNKLGLTEMRRIENKEGRYALIFVSPFSNFVLRPGFTQTICPSVNSSSSSWG